MERRGKKKKGCSATVEGVVVVVVGRW